MEDKKPVEEDSSGVLRDDVQQQDNQLITQIVNEKDPDKLKDLTHLFNIFQTKRQLLRLNALNDIQDSLIEQMSLRLKQQPHNFANSDISAWVKVIQQSLDSTANDIKGIDNLPASITQNNTQINVSVENTLSKESRDKILEVLQTILQNNSSEVDVVAEEEGEDLDNRTT